MLRGVLCRDSVKVTMLMHSWRGHAPAWGRLGGQKFNVHETCPDDSETARDHGRLCKLYLVLTPALYSMRASQHLSSASAPLRQFVHQIAISGWLTYALRLA